MISTKLDAIHDTPLVHCAAAIVAIIHRESAAQRSERRIMIRHKKASSPESRAGNPCYGPLRHSTASSHGAIDQN